MNTRLLSLIRADAYAWWYHRELRKRGQLVEARKREHSSIRGEIKEIRSAVKWGGWVSVGHGGTTFHYAPNAKCQGCHPGTVPLAKACGIPVVDLTTIPLDDLTHFAIRFPMAKPGLTEDEGTGWLQYVTFRTWVTEAIRLGATVHNCEEHSLP